MSDGVDEPGEHEQMGDYTGRSGRWARNEEIEKFMEIWEVTDEDPAYVPIERWPGYRFTLHHEVVIRVRWSEVYRYADGVLEAKAGFEEDPLGFVVDAMLEPRVDEDKPEILSTETRVEYDPAEEAPGEGGDD